MTVVRLKFRDTMWRCLWCQKTSTDPNALCVPVKEKQP